MSAARREQGPSPAEEPIDRAPATWRAPPLEDLLQRYLPRLQAFVRLRAGRAVRAHESAADIAQSVCRELLAGEPLVFADEAAFRHWLYTAAVRKVIQRHRYWRRAKRDIGREQPVADHTPTDALYDACCTLASPSQNAMANEFVAVIEAALADLPDHYREVLALTRGLGLTQRAAADVLGKTEIAVQRLLTRARVKLAASLRARGFDAGSATASLRDPTDPEGPAA